MISFTHADDSVVLSFQSDITFVDFAVEIIRKILDYFAVEDPTNLLLVSKELLKNAVVHGNQNDRTKDVVYRLSRSGQDQFRLEVRDGGAGFKREDNDRGGHGLEIVSRLCQQVDLDEEEGRIAVLLAST